MSCEQANLILAVEACFSETPLQFCADLQVVSVDDVDRHLIQIGEKEKKRKEKGEKDIEDKLECSYTVCYHVMGNL